MYVRQYSYVWYVHVTYGWHMLQDHSRHTPPDDLDIDLFLTTLLCWMGLFWYVWVSFGMYGSFLVCMGVNIHMFDISMSHMLQNHSQHTPSDNYSSVSDFNDSFGVYGSLVVYMGLLVYLCFFWYIWVSFGIYGSLLVYMGLFWYSWVSFGIYGSLLVCMGVNFHMFDMFMSRVSNECFRNTHDTPHWKP